jgi:hypothetical protein
MQMKTWIPLLSLAFLVGCAKKEAAVTELPPEAAAQVEAQVAAQVIPPPTAQPNAPMQERLVGAVHPQMTEKLLEFEQTFKRMPENFYEFSGRMMDSVPAAPPGMRYDIDPVDKAVKLVMKTE